MKCEVLASNALSLNEELIELRKHVKEQDKEIRRWKEENDFLRKQRFFRSQPLQVSKKQSFLFIDIKTEGGTLKGKISFYCKSLGVTRQGFHNYLKCKDKTWKYQSLADAMLDICVEDECNDTYGRIRMHPARKLKQPDGVNVPSERTVYRVMEENGISHSSKRKPNGITKADKET